MKVLNQAKIELTVNWGCLYRIIAIKIVKKKKKKKKIKVIEMKGLDRKTDPCGLDNLYYTH